ncbi:MAG TPA: class I SAM-dependent methyltransferase [Gammaproteobacteria bacterium]|nr:class I SAM-dependent methyltransferase [Gammaproteobacteria bacterium]
MAAVSNDIVVEAWNTVLFDKFVRFKHLLIDGLSGHSEEALARHPHPKGSRVLDVGCGFGDSTRRIARTVAPGGEAAGVDCAQNFVDAATRESEQAGIDNATFFLADVQMEDLRGPYDYAFARFGTMFFMSPGAALRNIRKALKPGGELTQIVWRRREDNPWLFEAEQRVRGIVPVISHEDTDEVHCGPGPFSMAEPDMVSAMMKGVGYDRITFERFDTDICIGRDVDEAIEFAMALGPAGEIIRLAAEEGERLKPRVMVALREALTPYDRGDGVWAPSSTWFITARNPG